MGFQDVRDNITDAFVALFPGWDATPPLINSAALRDSASLNREDSRELTKYLYKDDSSERFRDALDAQRSLAELDRWGVKTAITLVEDEHAERTLTLLAQHPGRLYAAIRVDPHRGVAGLRRLQTLVRQFDIIKAISISPYGIYPFIAPNAKEYYPVYAKAVEMNLPVYINVGIPGPRVPGEIQNPIHLDEVCWFFPDLKVVMRHGGEPWVDMCVKLMLKWPNLYFATSGFAPRHYPKEIIEYANTRGSDKIMYGGYWPVLPFEKLYQQLAELPLREHVWKRFFGENTRRVFKLD